MSEIDLRAAINAVSDVVQNRPQAIREFDQIYMKTGDMILQSEFISRWAAGKRVAFVGDGDAISSSVAYLAHIGILDSAPSQITVFDFDERIVNGINQFAESAGIGHLSAVLYNVFDELPTVAAFDAFYTNPPWGASNRGTSVKLFVERGFELVGYDGKGVVVLADDQNLEWPRKVLHAVESHALENGFFISRMSPQLHSYHLDDAPDLKSCNLVLDALPGNAREVDSRPRLVSDYEHFYGNGHPLNVRFIRQNPGSDPRRAGNSEYHFEYLDGST
ncbi:bis-aminopropyl spermidine synthase family protein [Microbacterium lacus]|uniref:bis-aminopropyl spermidine synthase family protein n=1 Tax=Microbacterium lacus TaxID=415217 RepID=UPI000C2CA8D8|nr:bis-aminopropyl spermidine synthase family protein [Microbacterium lacus]